MNWADECVLLTGGAGFLGSFLADDLRKHGATRVVVPRRSECDLRDRAEVDRVHEQNRPTLTIHLAARVGGIGTNQAHPAEFFYDNLLMGLHIVDAAHRFGVRKIVGIGTICSYPKFTPIPFSEDHLWDGYPEETNAPYGLAKKMLLVQMQAYRQQYGLRGIYLLPVNLYGPRDNFDPSSSHVIPALVRKCVEARNRGDREITVWGTGLATREFLYVEDAARGIRTAAERYEGAEPVNLGAGFEISIRELVGLIADLTRFRADIRWDTSKPDGQPRRSLDTSRALALFGFKATTSFETGLERTIDWFESHLASTAAVASAQASR
jgi:GDP-L-fucose synthase